MLRSKKRWIQEETSNQETISLLAEELKLAPIVASLLMKRGYHTSEEAKAFLFDDNNDFHDIVNFFSFISPACLATETNVPEL